MAEDKRTGWHLRSGQQRRAMDAEASYGEVEILEELAPAPAVRRFSETEDLSGLTLLGCYRVESRYAVGGMSVIYRARHLTLNRPCAIKVPQAPAPPAELNRVSREARIGALVSHPNVVRIYACGTLPDLRPFLVMELLTGRSLRQLMGADTVDSLWICHLIAQVASGLAALHALHIVHRDIKPSNLLMALPHRREWVKIIDLGLSKRPGEPEDNDVTMPHLLVGTPAYMPPEILGGEAATPLSDQWSLGCVLLEMLTGQPLSRDAYGSAHTPPLHLPGSGAPADELERLVRRMLEPDPARRFPSISQVEAELRRLAGDPQD